MIKLINIQNFALISSLEFTPGETLNIITGETGAGKSVLLGAIQLILGGRVRPEFIENKEKKCVVEIHFDLSRFELKKTFDDHDLDYEDTSIFRREIYSNGKSRAFINDIPVPLQTLKSIVNPIVDVHSQNDKLYLNSSSFQLNLIDLFSDNIPFLTKYKNEYKQMTFLSTTLKEKIQLEALEKKDLDYNLFLVKEFEKVELSENELQQSEQELTLLNNSENIKNTLNTLVFELRDNEQALLVKINELVKKITTISSYSSELKVLRERFEQNLIELKDITEELDGFSSSVEFDQNRINSLNERLSLIYNLLRKHNTSTVSDLIVIQNNLKEKINLATGYSAEIKELEDKLKKQNLILNEIANKLSEKRKKSFKEFTSQIEYQLHELGIPDAVFEINHKKKEFSQDGIDTIEFLFSANKGRDTKKLSEIASGGEMSRIMLALKYLLSEKTGWGVLIFDEIDTGISGNIAVKVAKMIEAMSEKTQIICITHLPQIASKGKNHFYVYKEILEEITYTRIKKLNKEERVTEITTMVDGETKGNTARKHAKELLGINN